MDSYANLSYSAACITGMDSSYYLADQTQYTQGMLAMRPLDHTIIMSEEDPNIGQNLVDGTMGWPTGSNPQGHGWFVVLI